MRWACVLKIYLATTAMHFSFQLNSTFISELTDNSASASFEKNGVRLTVVDEGHRFGVPLETLLLLPVLLYELSSNLCNIVRVHQLQPDKVDLLGHDFLILHFHLGRVQPIFMSQIHLFNHILLSVFDLD